MNHLLLCIAMTSLESEAFFDARMVSMGITAATCTAIRARNLTTLASFAFATGYLPNGSDDAVFKRELLEPVLGQGYETHADAPRLRRLFFEAHTLSIADLRRRSERTDADVPVRMPVEERGVRLAKMRRRLPGLQISGVLEPSHALIDLLVQQLESGSVKYVPWNVCTMRKQEVQGIKVVTIDPSSKIEPDSSGFLKMKKRDETYLADVNSDLLLTQAFQRRAIAYELAGICSYEVMNRVGEKFMECYMEPPISDRYHKVTLDQLESADRHLYIKMADDTASGLTMRLDGTSPVGDSIITTLASHTFGFLLMQMPKSSGSGPLGAGNRGKGHRDQDRSRSRRRKQSENDKAKAKAKAAGKAAIGSQGRGKGKGGGRGKTTASKTKDGFPICFGYNDRGCPAVNVKDGEKCEKGWHVCWLLVSGTVCGQPHSAHKHS